MTIEKGNISSRKPLIITQALNNALLESLNSPFIISAEDIHIEIIQYLHENQLPYTVDDLYSLRQLQRLKTNTMTNSEKIKQNSIRFAQNNSKASGQKITSQGFFK